MVGGGVGGRWERRGRAAAVLRVFGLRTLALLGAVSAFGLLRAGCFCSVSLGSQKRWGM